MTIDYTNAITDVLKAARDLLRNDSSLLTILNIESADATQKIFAQRPSDQEKQGFTNPRIVCEGALQEYGNYGENPDGYNTDEHSFQVSVWCDDKPWSTCSEAVARIKTVLNKAEEAISTGGKCTFYVQGSSIQQDPDKAVTMFGTVLVTADLLTQG